MTTYEFATDALKEPGLITNFRKDELALYKQAILHTTGLYISEVAYNRLGERLKDYYSLRRDGSAPDNLSGFWHCFDVLEAQKSAGVELWMRLPDEVERIHSNLSKTWVCTDPSIFMKDIKQG